MSTNGYSGSISKLQEITGDDGYCEIEEGLFIGSIVALRRFLDDCGLKQTTVLPSENMKMDNIAFLSVDIMDPFVELGLRHNALHVHAEDTADANLLEHFDRCHSFIKQNKDLGRRFYINCNAGVSRSTTILAAYLMKSYNLPYDVALRKIQKIRPIAMPNPNFLEQLRIYEFMGCTFHPGHHLYRRFVLRNLGSSNAAPESLKSYFANVPDISVSKGPLYCCKICRAPLFSMDNLLGHDSLAEDVVDPRKHPSEIETGFSNTPRCPSGELFVEPVAWMSRAISDQHGKLNCPKCEKKIGTYSWFGEKCACGKFVTPAFHMDKGKVEIRQQLR